MAGNDLVQSNNINAVVRKFQAVVMVARSQMRNTLVCNLNLFE